MSFQCILAPVDGVLDDRSVLRAALTVAGLHGGHVTGLLTEPPPANEPPVPWGGEGLALAAATAVRDRDKAGRRRRATAQRLFDEIMHGAGAKVIARPGNQGPGVSGALKIEQGFAIEVLRRIGPLHDLTVFGRGVRAADGQSADTLLLKATLLQVRRPVLWVPGELSKTFPAHACIAWAGGVEDALAVSAAMPLLLQAGTVSILAMEGGGPGAAAERLADYLRWHGVSGAIEPHRDSDAGRSPTPLLARAAERRADLLVMGIQTLGPLQQMIFGGVTDTVLRQAAMPVLMVH